MEDTLKRLLEAESRAQALVDDAFRQRDSMTEQAQRDARAAEQRFEARIDEIHSSFADKARQRAEQSIEELERRSEERSEELERHARERRDQAVRAALDILTDFKRL